MPTPKPASLSTETSPFLIVSLSGRALAEAARKAGYKTVVIDGFCDLDTRDMALDWAHVTIGGNGAFDGRELSCAADRLAPQSCGLVYGSGFEAATEVLRDLSRGRRLFGNTPESVARVKQPESFAALVRGLGLPLPETRRETPGRTEGWLIKPVGGSGGCHIRIAGASEKAGPGWYFQRRVAGKLVSASVICDGRHARCLGLSEQWTHPGSSRHPLRFGGALAPAMVEPQLHPHLKAAAENLIREAGLVGLNGVDFIVDRDRVFVIEINPRPCATIDLFDRLLDASLFDLHIRACLEELPRNGAALEIAPKQFRGCAVVYAERRLTVPKGFDWPIWSTDRPCGEAIIEPDSPLCTVHAKARQVEDVKALLQARRLEVVALMEPSGYSPRG